MDGQPTHALALKVMRLSRPTLAAVPQPYFEDEALIEHAASSVLSNQSNDLTSLSSLSHPSTTRDLSLSEVLTLSATFGSIQLGETFSGIVTVNNDGYQPGFPVAAVSLKVEMQTTTTKHTIGGIDLPSSGPDSVLNPAAFVQTVVHHEIKELGQHVLACIVSYRIPSTIANTFPVPPENPADPTMRTMRKFYKFMVTNPLSVKTKVQITKSPHASLLAHEREKVFLEVHIQNLTQKPMAFHRIRFECLDGWRAQDINAGVYDQDGGRTMPAGEVRQYLYVLTPTTVMQEGGRKVISAPTPGSTIGLGRLDISWTTAFGEPGRLLTSLLSRRVPLPATTAPNPVPPPKAASALPPHIQPQARRPHSPSASIAGSRPGSPAPFRVRGETQNPTQQTTAQGQGRSQSPVKGAAPPPLHSASASVSGPASPTPGANPLLSSPTPLSPSPLVSGLTSSSTPLLPLDLDLQTSLLILKLPPSHSPSSSTLLAENPNSIPKHDQLPVRAGVPFRVEYLLAISLPIGPPIPPDLPMTTPHDVHVAESPEHQLGQERSSTAQDLHQLEKLDLAIQFIEPTKRYSLPSPPPPQATTTGKNDGRLVQAPAASMLHSRVNSIEPNSQQRRSRTGTISSIASAATATGTASLGGARAPTAVARGQTRSVSSSRSSTMSMVNVGGPPVPRRSATVARGAQHGNLHIPRVSSPIHGTDADDDDDEEEDELLLVGPRYPPPFSHSGADAHNFNFDEYDYDEEEGDASALHIGASILRLNELVAKHDSITGPGNMADNDGNISLSASAPGSASSPRLPVSPWTISAVSTPMPTSLATTPTPSAEAPPASAASSSSSAAAQGPKPPIMQQRREYSVAFVVEFVALRRGLVYLGACPPSSSSASPPPNSGAENGRGGMRLVDGTGRVWAEWPSIGEVVVV